MSEFKRYFLSEFAFESTEDQKRAMEAIFAFLQDTHPHKLLLISGYAGTGKTTLIGHLVQCLQAFSFKTQLMAPTGRAAKVFSGFARQKAYTIHKKIYRKQKISNGSIQLALAPNLTPNTLYIVDEASMIGDFSIQGGGAVSERNLLEDLFSFVYQGKNCSMILVGDEGQLPPVGSDFSPALNRVYLENHFPQLQIRDVNMKEVMRQAAQSDILFNASKLRGLSSKDTPKFELRKKKDLFSINGLEFQEMLESSYREVGKEECIVITRSNKRANAYNNEIRRRILFFEEEISSGDILMSVKNNYFWVGETSDAGFIANGELLRVKKVLGLQELYGFRFQKAQVELLDYPDMGSFEVQLLLDALQVEAPSLPREDMKKLFFEVEQDYMDERNKVKRYEKVLANPYFNALQVKFAYAVTCHKAQGGQWEDVFLDHGFLPEEQIDASFYRWLYTGFTRAKNKLFLVNFDERFLKKK